MTVSRIRIHGVGLLAALAPTLAACGHQGGNSTAVQVTIPDDPKGTVDTVVKSIADGQPVALWAALPKSYQHDVNELVHQFGASVDAEVYDQSFGLAKRIVGVLRDKKQFILDHPMVGSMADRGEVEANWDSIVGIFDTLVQSELSSTTALKKLDVGRFLQGTGATMMRQVANVAKLSSEDKLGQLARAQVQLVKSEGDRASVKVTLPGERDETIELKRVEGRWIPTDMARDWTSEIAKAKEKLKTMNGPDQKAMMQVRMGLGMANAVVGQLEAAKTQEEFNEVLSGLMGMGLAAPR
ncbi:MAG: hypothetical protein AAF628_05825 [Planctomycetota bacterium]